MSLLEDALLFAIDAHKKQFRKFDQTAYIKHPMSVMGIMTEYTDDEAVLAACLLHDTVEDIDDITLETMHDTFGERVASIVFYVTEKSTKADGNRKVRKQIDKEHYSRGTIDSQNVKVADMLDNIPGIVLCDPEFAVVYLREKTELLESLVKADPELRSKARRLIKQMYTVLGY